MTNIKSTRRAFLSSVVAMLICISMLLGTTFAWFTDEITSAGNVITTGNLDIELDYWDGDSWETVHGASSLFSNELWEPGHTEVVYLKLSNLGSLALKYQLSINVMSEIPGTNVAGDPFMISDYIQMGVRENVDGENAPYASRGEAVESVETASGIIGDGYVSTGSMLAGDPELYMAVVVYMPETVGDEVNPMPNTTLPAITLGINLFATQFANENDSFGNDYDKEAPIVSAPVARPTGAVTLKGAEDVKVTLNDTIVNSLPAEITEIGMSVSEPVVDVVNKTITYATIELLDQNGEVIDLEALNLGEKITVTLPAQTTFAPGETVVLYHDGEYVATAVVNNDTTISYKVEHLCEVSVGAVELPEAVNNVLTISTAAELFGFAQSVNAGKTYEGITVVLANDIDLKGAAWTPIGSAETDHGFMGNFDGNGKTISNLNIKVDATSANDYAYAGFFGVTEGTKECENYVKDLTIENVTVNTASQIVAGVIAYPYYTAVENITVCGDIAIKGGNYTAGILGYTRYCLNATNLTVNGNEGSYITGGTTVGGVIADIQIKYGLSAANYSDFTAANVTVTGDKCVGGISGIICGQTLNGATVENVTLVCSDKHVGIVSGSFSSADYDAVINNVTYSNVTGATAIAGAPYNSTSGAAAYVFIEGVEYAGNLAAVNEQLATGTVNFACDINGDITVTQAPDVAITINGMGNKLNGVITVDGKSGTYTTAALTIKNVTFGAFTGSADASIRLGDGTNATRYTCNVTVDNCTFDAPGKVGVKSYTGGDKCLTIINSTATANAHSLVQAKGIDNVKVADCEAYSKNGLNFNNSTNVSVDNCTVDVKGYAVRFGETSGGSGDAETYTITNSTLKSANDDGDAVIVLRGTADYSTLTITGTTITGDIKFTNTAVEAAIVMDGMTVATNGDTLVAALERGENVILANDIKIEPAKMSNAYGKTGVNVRNGQILDGNGYTLDVKGAGGTWDSGICVSGGTIKNITVTGSFRGIFVKGGSQKVILENVTTTGTTYTISCDAANGFGLEATNCNFNGWTSFAAALGEVKFVNCNFGPGSGYNFSRPYATTSYVGCTFAAGHQVDARGKVALQDCTFNGEAVTAENVAALVTGNTANATVVEG